MRRYGHFALFLILSTSLSFGQEQWTLPTDDVLLRGDLNRSNQTYYPFPELESRREWVELRQAYRDQILFTMGCYPEPPKSPLNIERTVVEESDSVIVETIRFQSLPGIYVTGNLHRPASNGEYPAILSVHGHWGAGRFENSESNAILARSNHFARMGYVVLTIDMVGYVDFTQIPHGWGERKHWQWGLNAHGLQYWNTVRAVDALVSMDVVDETRIGMTGASGGGTQTLFLMATDDRIHSAAPVNMISSHFQGGCICENAPGLRIHGFNTPFAAMMGPNPLLMVSASGDWTNETLIEEYPAVKSVYALYDAADQVSGVQVDAPHNYNLDSNSYVYSFFSEAMDTLLIGEEEPLTGDLTKYRVHPNGTDDLPEDAINLDELFAQWKQMSEQQIQVLAPETPIQISMLERRGAKGLALALQAEFPGKDDLIITRHSREQTDYGFREGYTLGRIGVNETIPLWVFLPNQTAGTRPATVLLHDDGIQAFVTEDAPGDMILSLLEQGNVVLIADLFHQGAKSAPDYESRVASTAHFYTYNKSITALQVQDALTIAAYADSRYDTDRIRVVGKEKTGIVTMLAAAVEDRIDAIAVDSTGRDFSSDEVLLEIFVPGLRRAGDVRVAQALLAPRPALIMNTQGTFSTDWAGKAYATHDSAAMLNVYEGVPGDDALLDWLAK